jgi:hypothetical protein
MPRGRRAQPDTIKAIKGNPGKRKLLASSVARRGSLMSAAQIMPGFVTKDREKELFRRVIDEYLQRRIARASDANAYARYAVYLNRWWICKEALDDTSTVYQSESLHGKLYRDHPLFRQMLHVERVLMALEDRLGLNVVSRQSIIRGLAAVPPAFGDLFGDKPKTEDKPEGEAATPAEIAPQERPPSPVGFGRLN